MHINTNVTTTLICTFSKNRLLFCSKCRKTGASSAEHRVVCRKYKVYYELAISGEYRNESIEMMCKKLMTSNRKDWYLTSSFFPDVAGYIAQRAYAIPRRPTKWMYDCAVGILWIFLFYWYCFWELGSHAQPRSMWHALDERKVIHTHIHKITHRERNRCE